MEPEVKPLDPEPEPELAEVEVKPGERQKVNVGPILAAERARIRQAERENHAKELEPLKTKAAQADQLAADLQALQPHIDYLNKHRELLNRDEPPAIQAVSDEEAESFAREYELFTANGLNIPKAKQLIAKQRAEIKRVASEAAAEAVKPVAERTALDQSRANFTAAYYAKDASGRPLVDPQILTDEWKKVPAAMSAQPEIAQLILDRAIGAMYRQGKQPPAAPEREPLFSEPAGGRSANYQMSDTEKKMARHTGTSDKDWQATASKFTPGAINVIGD